MPDSPEKRTEQLQSIVNELTARIAGDPGNADLPPLLASAQAELDALKGASGATATGTPTAAPAAPAAVVRPKLTVPPAKPAAAPARHHRPKRGARPASRRTREGTDATLSGSATVAAGEPRTHSGPDKDASSCGIEPCEGCKQRA